MFNPIQPSRNSHQSFYSRNPDPSFPYSQPLLPYALPSDPTLQPPGIDAWGSSYSYPRAHGGFDAQAAHYRQQNLVSEGWVVKQADPITYSAPILNPLTENLTVSRGMNSLWNNTHMTQLDDASNETSMQTKVTPSMRCEVCKINCNSKDVFDKHVQGKKHKKNVLPYAMPATTLNAMAGQSPRPCTVCNIMCNSEEAYNKHLYGKKHTLQAALSLTNGIQPLAATPSSISWMQKKLAKKAKLVQSAWCEVCKLYCNSGDIFSQHLLGKKHQKNVERLEKSKEVTSGSASTIATTSMVGPAENPAASKRKTSNAAKSVKKEGSSEDLEAKKRKVMEGGAAVSAVRVCSLCNVVCNSETVFTSHLSGQKHLAMLRKSGTVITSSGL